MYTNGIYIHCTIDIPCRPSCHVSDETQTPDIHAIWNAYAGLDVTIYASRLAIREVPERVRRVHGILERKLIQNGFDPKHPELWCRPATHGLGTVTFT